MRGSDAKGAREGPIADFLRNYPTHEKSGQIKHGRINMTSSCWKTADANPAARLQSGGHRKILWREALDDEDAASSPKPQEVGGLSKRKGHATPTRTLGLDRRALWRGR